MTTDFDDEDRARVAVDGDARLERTIVEAFYLGHSMRALAGEPDFAFRQMTAAVGEPLIAWAKFIEERLEAGERPFGARRPHAMDGGK